MMRKILIIEDDLDLAAMLKTQLEVAKFKVTPVGSGSEGLAEIGRHCFGLIILDLGLPDMDGVEVCRRIRWEGHRVPVIILTARDNEFDRIMALELGADDCILKPFSYRELLARIRALLRRTVYFASRDREEVDKILRAGALSIDMAKRKVLLNRCQLNLTAKEFDLLGCLAQNPGKVFSRRELLHRVWGYQNDCYEHTVTSHVNRLRAKLEKDSSRSSYILTVWGIGYKFREGDGAA